MAIKRLLIATDAWKPQINGVVQTLTMLTGELERRDIVVDIISPDGFLTLPLPTYPDIRIALAGGYSVRERITVLDPEHVHIATEGPIGWAVRKVVLERNMPFTTSYHTRFPEYLARRAPVPIELSYAVLRHFHNAGAGIMVATPSLEDDLRQRGFANMMRWGRGVDLARFTPDAPPAIGHEWPRPIFLYVGRLAPEKNLDAFLSLNLPGTKVVAGDGPSADELRERYRQVVFLGPRTHAELPAIYANADVFVFPSRTDTFGLVIIEALACGVPVAAFPVAGPRDIIGQARVGVLSEDLRQAAMSALTIDREACRRHARDFTWERSADQFLANIAEARVRAGHQSRLSA